MFPVLSTALAIFILLVGLDFDQGAGEPSFWPGACLLLGLIVSGELLILLARKRLNIFKARVVRLLLLAYGLYPVAAFAYALFLLDWSRFPAWIGLDGWILADKAALVGFYLLLSNTTRFYRNRFARSLGLVSAAYTRNGHGLAFKAELTLMLPFLLLILFADLVELDERVNDWFTHLPVLFWVGIFLVFAALAMLMPGFIKVLWRLKPLAADSQLRAVLADFMASQRFKAKDILVLDTNGQLINAAILGFIPRARYIIFTDAMLKHLSPPELKAVLAHEMGHGRKRHIPLYLVFSVAFVFGVSLLENLFSPLAHLEGSAEPFIALLAPAVLIYWWLVFGFLSRRFEMEADIFGAAALEDPRLFMNTLEHVAHVGRVEKKRGSWRHFSIDRRVSSLRKVFFDDPGLAMRFWRRMRWVRQAIILLSILLFLLFAGELAVDTYAGLGVLAYKNGDSETALARLERASRFPWGGIHRWTLFKLRVDSGRLEEADRLLDELTSDMEPGAAPDLLRWLLVEFGLSSLHEGDEALSMKIWGQGQKLFPEDSMFFELKRCTTFFIAGDPEPLNVLIEEMKQHFDEAREVGF
jgi:Zn-dependent protease with chaperone function